MALELSVHPCYPVLETMPELGGTAKEEVGDDYIF